MPPPYFSNLAYLGGDHHRIIPMRGWEGVRPAPGSHLGSTGSKALLGPGVQDLGLRKGEAFLEQVAFLLAPPSSLASSLQHPVPHLGYRLLERPKRRKVRRNGIVPIVPLQHTAQPCVLLGHRTVFTPSALFRQTRELRTSLLPRGPAPQLEPPSPVHPSKQASMPVARQDPGPLGAPLPRHVLPQLQYPFGYREARRVRCAVDPAT